MENYNIKYHTFYFFLSKLSLVNTLAQVLLKFRAVFMLSGDIKVLKVEAYWEGRAFFWERAALPHPTQCTFLWPARLCQMVFLCSQHDEHGPLGHYSVAQSSRAFGLP